MRTLFPRSTSARTSAASVADFPDPGKPTTSARSSAACVAGDTLDSARSARDASKTGVSRSKSRLRSAVDRSSADENAAMAAARARPDIVPPLSSLSIRQSSSALAPPGPSNLSFRSIATSTATPSSPPPGK
eukprot:31518-Pelagococcus_subviridis.AAC.12